MNEWKSPQYLQKAFPEELKSSVQDTNCLKTSANKSWRVTGERCIIRPTESVPRLVGPSNTVRIWVNKTERLSCLTGRPLKQHATSPWPEQHQALGTDQFYIRDEKEYMFLMGFCSGANQSHIPDQSFCSQTQTMIHLRDDHQSWYTNHICKHHFLKSLTMVAFYN